MSTAAAEAEKKKSKKFGLGTAKRPAKRNLRQKIRFFFYDNSDGTVKCLTRTPISWLQLILFFIIFYTFLNFYISSLMYIWTKIFGDDYEYLEEYPSHNQPPHRVLEDSLIGVHPGVNIRPHYPHHLLQSKQSIRYELDIHHKDTDSVPSNDEGEGPKNMDFITRLELFLNHYDYPASDEYLAFDMSQLVECAVFPYGYLSEEEDASPCLLIGVNRVWGWTPTPVDETDIDNEDWPQQFKSHWRKQLNKNFVWIHCEDLDKCDDDGCTEEESGNIGQISYYPENQGIDIDYYPYLGVSENSTYHTPVVAIKLRQTKLNQRVLVECRAYYKGVVHETRLGEQTGLVQFEYILRD